MKRKLTILAMLLAMTFFWLPSDSNTVAAQGRGNSQNRGHGHGRDRDMDRGWEQNRGHKKRTYGYKNYGQYRRTQVGNRRYRLVRRPYWSNGIRLTRNVRVYY